MHTFFVEQLPPEGGIVALDPDESRHLKVRRLRAGEAVRAVDGRGGRAQGRYLARNELELEKPGLQPPPQTRLVLLQAAIPAERLDWALQKAVESGVSAVYVYGAERKAGKDLGRKEDRWGRIAREAAKQCGRADFPPIRWQADLSAALTAEPLEHVWMADRGGERAHFGDTSPAAVGLVVGPEGGFSPGEREVLQQAGARAMTLGPFTLRSETVAPAGLAVLHYGYAAWQDTNEPI